MLLRLKTGPLCPIFHTKVEERCSFSKVPDGLCTWFSNILRVQKEGTQICMSEWSQGLTLTRNVDQGFLLSTTFPKIKSSGSKKGTQICYPFPQRVSANESPPGSPTGPLWRDTRLQCIFTSHLVYPFLSFPQESPLREPPPCSLTGSPWAAILRHQSHWSTFHSFIHVCLLESPKRSPTTYIWEKT